MGHWEDGCGAVREVWELELCSVLLPTRNFLPTAVVARGFLGIGKSWCHPPLLPGVHSWAGASPHGALLCPQRCWSCPSTLGDCAACDTALAFPGPCLLQAAQEGAGSARAPTGRLRGISVS